MSRSRRRSGAEQLLLHMGYFATRDEAEQCLKLMRGTYPNAVASAAPAALLRESGARVPTLQPAQPARGAPAPVLPHLAQSDGSSLTDTQVLKILETRDADGGGNRTGPTAGRDISVLRPDDTDTRRALKQAVVQNSPVSFSIQLLWSVQPIDLATVPSLDIFRAYTLYVAEGHRDGRSWHCLRLGFFRDAISARQVAHYVRSTFTAVAVVPITEEERVRAHESPTPSSSAPVPSSAEPAKPRPASAPVKAPAAATTPVPVTKPANGTARRARHDDETLEQTLELLAASDTWTDDGSPSDTGVRHLSVTVKKRASGRF